MHVAGQEKCPEDLRNLLHHPNQQTSMMKRVPFLTEKVKKKKKPLSIKTKETESRESFVRKLYMQLILVSLLSTNF
jgi:hypothetical protein